MNMPVKWIALLLIGVGVLRIGVYGRAISGLLRQREALQATVGKFELSDDCEFQIHRRSTASPFHFEWSFCHALGKLWSRYEFQDATGNLARINDYHTIYSSGLIIRHSIFVEFGDDEVFIHVCGLVERRLRVPSSPTINQWLQRQWSQLEIEVAAEQGLQRFPAGQDIALLTIQIPQRLRDQVDDNLGGELDGCFPERLIFRYQLFNDDSIRE